MSLFTQVQVSAVRPGGPADNDGRISPGDVLVAINGVSIIGSTHAAVVRLLNTFLFNELGCPVVTDVQLLLRGYRLYLVEGGETNCLHTASFHSNSLGVSRISELESHSDSSTAAKQCGTSSSGSPTSWPSGESKTRLKIQLHKRPDEGFGVIIITTLSPTKICRIGGITTGSPAERCGILHVGDRIISINGRSLTEMPHFDVAEQMRSDKQQVVLVIEKQTGGQGKRFETLSSPREDYIETFKITAESIAESKLRRSRSMYNPTSPPDLKTTNFKCPLVRTKEDDEVNSVILHREANGFGFLVGGGYEYDKSPLFVLRIEQNSQVQLFGKLQVGDEILEINGISTEKMTRLKAMQIIQSEKRTIRLCLARLKGQPLNCDY